MAKGKSPAKRAVKKPPAKKMPPKKMTPAQKKTDAKLDKYEGGK